MVSFVPIGVFKLLKRIWKNKKIGRINENALSVKKL